MDREIQQRLHWVELYSQCKDAGLVCRRCGISLPTLRKWWCRYQEAGLAGLQSLSQRPHHLPATKVGEVEEALILDLRRLRNLGARRIQSELLRQNNLSLGLATIHKILQRNQVAPIVICRRKKDYTRYEKSTPGDRVQLDTCKIAPGLIQYTSVDDCTKYRVLRLYNRRTASNTLDFKDVYESHKQFIIRSF